MSGRRSPHRTQFEFWITREASAAINLAAEKQDITRGQYIQNAIWDAIEDICQPYQRQLLLPVPTWTNTKYIRYDQHQPGYKGRWSMWVKGRATVHNSVPMMLTRQAEALGHGSATALVRHCLALSIKRDTGKTVPMPKGRGDGDLFGGKINEVAL